MTISVLHVAQPCEGGVAGYLVAACLDQAARGWRVAVACPDGGRLADDLAREGIPRLRWAAVRSPGPVSLGETLRLRALIDRHRPDVVHLHASKAGLAGRLGPRRPVPVVFQPHGWSWLAVEGRMRTAALAWEQYAARRTDLLLCVGDAEAAEGRSYGVRGRYAVVHNGVDLDRFRPVDQRARAGARARLGVPVDAPLAVCVGRVTRQKGQDILLAAWPVIRRYCPDARLALVGGGDLLPKFSAVPMPGVTFAGPVPDVRDWLAAADVVVLPSRWEGLSLTVLEALATGRSVVVSDVPGLGEMVVPGVGKRVAAGDPAALADAVTRRLISGSLAHTEGVAAARHATGFDTKVTFARLAGETEAILQRNDRRVPAW
jgi:glycosyltransferase involved in cell wall biosynthesis